MTTTTLPKLEGFEEHYGIPVSTIGEDGDMVALGHHTPIRTFAAMRAYARAMFGDGGPQTLNAVEVKFGELATGCDGVNEPDHDADTCRECFAIRDGDWWMRVSATPEPGSFPVMYWTA